MQKLIDSGKIRAVWKVVGIGLGSLGLAGFIWTFCILELATGSPTAFS
jgi:hypothetical protein